MSKTTSLHSSPSSVIQAQDHLPDPEEERVFSIGLVCAFCHHFRLHAASGSPGVPDHPIGQSHPQTLCLQGWEAQETSVSCQWAGPFPHFLSEDTASGDARRRKGRQLGFLHRVERVPGMKKGNGATGETSQLPLSWWTPFITCRARKLFLCFSLAPAPYLMSSQ